MNAGTTACIAMGSSFMILAIVFAAMKEKAAILISGFNMMSKQEREQYDQAEMSRDMKNSLLIWTLIYAAGAVFSSLISSKIAVLAFVIWLILFFRDVHLDNKKAFDRYRKQKDNKL
ncbi:MAG: DUF3784 domain-containing protein [Erysipelotrichia bacterium]|nr:DUF3784 domain-containing protein [Erysipelotrichia bacterium]